MVAKGEIPTGTPNYTVTFGISLSLTSTCPTSRGRGDARTLIAEHPSRCSSNTPSRRYHDRVVYSYSIRRISCALCCSGGAVVMPIPKVGPKSRLSPLPLRPCLYLLLRAHGAAYRALRSVAVSSSFGSCYCLKGCLHPLSKGREGEEARLAQSRHGIHRRVGWLYRVRLLWLLPVVGPCVSLYFNASWCSLITERTFTL